MGLSFYDALDKYLDEIRADYSQCIHSGRESLEEHQQKMLDEFIEGVSYKEGKNYVKVFTGNSVHSFVVLRHDDKKFQCGDILKAASYNAPARNFSRGSIYRDDKVVRWTGA